MWITTCHRFADRPAFSVACDQAGWEQNPKGEPTAPAGVAVDALGPIVGPALVGPGGVQVPGAVLDAGYHVNFAWHARDVDPAFAGSLVQPATPARAWDLPTATEAGPPPVPASIPAWKGKAALREAGLLDAVDAAVHAAGGRVRDAWAGASEWSRDSDFLASLTTGLGLTEQQINSLFRAAGAIPS